ncbi:unnamed protein product [Paramecium primaurelia]|uniref:Cytochrome c domain-containing protein n=1 Tax=Paramecium primaurelia TaxID=5886 RepID=A0A8S1KGE1_PARPR|nr:unnamed protein product [Paramecium primaurelia]
MSQSRFDVNEQIQIPNGNAIKGQQMFEFKCSACHNFEDDKEELAAPTLKKIMGKRIGSTMFHYSKSMRNCNEIWTEKNMFLFLKDPKAFFRDTKMAQTKIANPQERADIIEFLKSL